MEFIFRTLERLRAKYIRFCETFATWHENVYDGQIDNVNKGKVEV